MIVFYTNWPKHLFLQDKKVSDPTWGYFVALHSPKAGLS
jgi:hypothetical protein